VADDEMLSAQDAQKAWDEEANRTDPVELAPETQPEPEPVLEPDDPFAGLPPALMEKLNKIDDLQRANEDLKNHVKAAEGRVAAWQRERDQQRQQAEIVAPTRAEVSTASANPEKWNQLKDDFPEWAEAMEEYVSSRVGQSAQGVSPDQINALIEQRTAQIRNETRETVEYAKLETKHEDWKETVNSPEFLSWVNTQPVNVYNLIDSPKATDAVKVLDLYKSATKTPTLSTVDQIKSQRKATLSNALSTKPGVPRQSKTIDSMSPEELWNYEARQLKKRQEQQGF
jgi:hypothetical protein